MHVVGIRVEARVEFVGKVEGGQRRARKGGAIHSEFSGVQNIDSGEAVQMGNPQYGLHGLIGALRFFISLGWNGVVK